MQTKAIPSHEKNKYTWTIDANSRILPIKRKEVGFIFDDHDFHNNKTHEIILHKILVDLLHSSITWLLERERKFMCRGIQNWSFKLVQKTSQTPEPTHLLFLDSSVSLATHTYTNIYFL